jgi:hypothetical protein
LILTRKYRVIVALGARVPRIGVDRLAAAVVAGVHALVLGETVTTPALENPQVPAEA